MKHALLFQWEVSAGTGWGVYGLNLLRWWQALAGAPAYCGQNIDLESLGRIDPLRLITLTPLIASSLQAKGAMRPAQGEILPFNGAVLHGMGNLFAGPDELPGLKAWGSTNFAVTFFEDTRLPNAKEVCGKYELMIAGSSWCEGVLRGSGVSNVAKVLQGVDTALFHPAPRSGMFEGRFVVFSGGKLEYRKGQDLVVSAFRAFSQRHPEALLITAWHSPWPQIAETVNNNPTIAPLTFHENGKINVARWMNDNGVAEHQFIELPSVPNYLMPRVLQEVDVALFPNRSEGGTNLVAMECLASGIPVIASNNTGHKDLMETGAPFALTSQKPVTWGDTGTDGWGESDVEEIVESLEKVWTDRNEALRRGSLGAAAMSSWAWKNQIKVLHDTIAQ